MINDLNGWDYFVQGQFQFRFWCKHNGIDIAVQISWYVFLSVVLVLLVDGLVIILLRSKRQVLFRRENQDIFGP